MILEELLAPGHRTCAGCGEVIGVRQLLRVLGKNTVICCATGCMEITTTPFPETSWKLPWVHVAFENTAAVASGVECALKKLGKEDVNVVALGGDGGMVDIGFQAASGAMERGHNILIVCTDNEAYMNCLSRDSWVMSETGLKRITEISKNEKVYAYDLTVGKPVLKKCTGVFDNGVKEVFLLETLHHSIKATGNHPFLVLKRNGRGWQNGLVWKTLEKLSTRDKVVVLKDGGKGKSYAFGKTKGVSAFSMEKIKRIKPLGVEPTLDLRVEGEHNFICNGIVVHNTGVQRSGSTPLYAATTTSPAGKVIPGKRHWKKSMVEICAAHGIPYAASASIAYPQDLEAKLKKALSYKGPKYLHIQTPCPIGWRHDSALTIDVAKLAVETGMWVLYEIENGDYHITYKPATLKPIKEYLQLQGRFKHLASEQIDKLQELVIKNYERLISKEKC